MKNIDNNISTNDKDAGLALILILLIVEIITKNGLLIIPITTLLVIAMTAPILFRPFTIIWFGLSSILGRYSSSTILTILFIFIVIPISYLRRISDSDPLQLKKWRKDQESSFTIRDHTYKEIDMDKPF
ncbi:MAG: hypothetical protein HQK63_04535 [Desulfamplus sp.]|nr:hypothetical protein [Desulfamplus sp.]